MKCIQINFNFFLYVDKNLIDEDIKKDRDDFYIFINEKLNILFNYFKDETITNDAEKYFINLWQKIQQNT